MSGLYLQTPSLVLNILGGSQQMLAKWVTDLLQTEDWVRLGSNFGGVLATWTVMERGSDGIPSLTVFEKADGTTELFDTNAGNP